jgi:ABC-type lipoprotein release transport system permease subunit
MLGRHARRLILISALVLAGPSSGSGQAAPASTASTPVVVSVRATGGALLPQATREGIRAVPNVRAIEPFLEGTTSDGVRLIGVEPAPTLHRQAGQEVRLIAIVQGRGFEPGDAPEALVVGKTFSQKNKTALGLSIPAMLTTDHFPPIIVGGQGFAIIGIYETGDAATDDQVLVLLPTAQKLLNQPGRLSGLYVMPASPGAVEALVSALRRTLGGSVEVAPLPRRAR